MIMSILSILAGYATWTVLFLGGGAGIRSVMASSHDAAGYTSDVSVLMVYLALSMFASATAGFVTAKISKVKVKRDTRILAGALLATGIPVQLMTWSLIPVWYNVAFLALLVPLTLWGSTFIKSKTW
jgi:hypothetical protein